MFGIFKRYKNKTAVPPKARGKENGNDRAPGKTGKAAPSGNPFFQMKVMDWGAHRPGETDCWKYYVYEDGRVEYQYNGFLDSFSCDAGFFNADESWSGLLTGRLEREDLAELLGLMKSFPENSAAADCFDGTGYEMTMYGKDGKTLHTTCGYIYGNSTLEKIAVLVRRTRKASDD